MMSGNVALIQKSIRSTAPEPKVTPAEPPLPAVPSGVAGAPARPLPPKGLNLADGYPATVAVLHVYTDGEDGYRVWGCHGDREPLNLPPIQPANPLPLKAPKRRWTDEEQTPRECFNLMTVFSAGQLELRQWLQDARAADADALQLVIADHTIYGIPWEMFRLENVRHDCLGSAVTTTRWGQPVDEKSNEYVKLCIEADECRGTLMSFIDPDVDPDERAKIEADLKVLDKLAHESPDSIHRAMTLLGRKRSGYGLVYLFCHGIVGETVLEMELGSQDNPKHRVHYAELLRQEMHLLDRSRSIVFLNACNSGRAVEDREFLCDDKRRHFCDLFLTKGARGVIGTLDKLHVRHAARVAREFLELAAAHPDWSVARVLRELRAQCVASLPRRPTDRQLDRWFYTSLYVYYGNPLTVLRLGGKGGPRA
jgi:hypothetical protein